MEGASDAAAPAAAMPAPPTTVLCDIGGLLSVAIRNSVCFGGYQRPAPVFVSFGLCISWFHSRMAYFSQGRTAGVSIGIPRARDIR